MSSNIKPTDSELEILNILETIVLPHQDRMHVTQKIPGTLVAEDQDIDQAVGAKELTDVTKHAPAATLVSAKVPSRSKRTTGKRTAQIVSAGYPTATSVRPHGGAVGPPSARGRSTCAN